MAKRVGANRRRKMAERRVRTHRGGLEFLRPFFRIGRIVLLIAIIGSAGFVGAKKASAWIDTSELFLVENVRVRGVSLLDTADVLAKANISLGQQLMKLDTKDVLERLKQNPLVNGVRLRRRFPNTIDIIIRERRPIAMLCAGEVKLVDKEGVLCGLVSDRYVDVPAVSGLHDTVGDDGIERLTVQSCQRLVRLLDGMREARPEIARRISQIAFHTDGSVRMRLVASDVVIDMETDDIKRRTQQLWHLIKREYPSEKRQPRRIELRYANLAFVR